MLRAKCVHTGKGRDLIHWRCDTHAAHSNVCSSFGIFCLLRKLKMKCKVQVNQLGGQVLVFSQRLEYRVSVDVTL